MGRKRSRSSNCLESIVKKKSKKSCRRGNKEQIHQIEMGGYDCGFSQAEMRDFKQLLFDYSKGLLRLRSKNYWDTAFWIELCHSFNAKGYNRRWEDMIIAGEMLRSTFCMQRAAQIARDADLNSIFEPSTECRNRIMVFPVSLLKHANIPSGSRSASTNHSRASTSPSVARYRGSIAEQNYLTMELRSQCVGELLGLYESGALSLDEITKIINASNTWTLADNASTVALIVSNTPDGLMVPSLRNLLLGPP